MKARTDFDRIIEETRARGRWRGSLLLALILAFFIVFFIWAATTEIDNVTRGDGRVVPSRSVQIVQTAETSILDRLHVREGELVDEGTVLMELDRTDLSGQLDREQLRAFALAVRISRLQAEIREDAELVFDDYLLNANAEILEAERSLFTGRQLELQAELQVLERQRIQRIQELEEAMITRTSEAEIRLLIDREFSLIEPMVQRQIEPETTLLALYRSRAESDASIARTDAALLRLEAAIAEVDDRVASVKNRFRSEALSEVAQATAELSEIQSLLPALAQRVTRSDLRAPVRGIVNRIHLTTRGGVAQAGQPLVEIVPLDDTLLVEAYIRPSDIAFLYPGQRVRVKLTAYDFSRYGGLDGEITRIGADAIPRPDRPPGEEQVFVVQVRTHSNILDADGQTVEIVPGMVAEVDILSGRRSVIDYIVGPIVRVRDRALRD